MADYQYLPDDDILPNEGNPALPRAVSPGYILLIILAVMFVIESAIMTLLGVLTGLSPLQSTLLDSIALTGLAFPALYFIIVPPLLKQNRQYWLARQAALESERRLRGVFDQTYQFMCLLGPEGDILQANQSMLNLFEVHQADLCGRPVWEAFHLLTPVEELQQKLEKAFQAAMQGQLCRLEMAINNSKAERIHLDISLKPLRDAQDRVTLLILEGHDITGHRETEQELQQTNSTMKRAYSDLQAEIVERQRVEADLRQSEYLLRTVLDTLPVGVLMIDRQGNIIQANPEHGNIWGGTRFVGIDKYNLYKGWHLDTGQLIQPEEWAGVRAITRGETNLNEEVEIESFAGVRKIILNSAVPICDTQENIIGAVIVNQDITARKRAEEQLSLNVARLEALTLAESKQRKLAERLVQVASTLNASLNLPEVLDSILEHIQEVIPFRVADIVLMEEDTFYVARSRGLEDFPAGWASLQQRFCTQDFPLIQSVYDTRQVVGVPDVRLNPDWRIVPGMEWVRAYACAPLLINDQVIGMININNELPYTYEPEGYRHLGAFAAQAAVAIHNARAYEAEIQAHKTSVAMYLASRALASSLDIDSVINSLIEFVGRLTPCDSAYVYLIDEQSHLVLHGSSSPQQPALTEDSFLFQAMLAGKKSLLISDTEQFSDWETRPGYETMRSWLGAPILSGESVIGVLEIGQAAPDSFTSEHQKWVETLVALATVAIQNAWLFEQVRAGRARLQALSRRLVEVQENERRYISRELHDEAGQALTSLMVSLSMIKRAADQPEYILGEVTEMERVLEGAIDGLHRLAVDLRPASLSYLGLAAALRLLVENIQQKSGLLTNFETLGFDDQGLPPELEIALYRIVQEALTNVVRFAQASRVDVLIQRRGSQLVVLVEDDGIGFDPQQIGEGDHLGLVGMRERAEMLGGKLIIESTSGKGTTILVEVPYDNEDTDRR